jgi:histidine triad (HIT) family protein
MKSVSSSDCLFCKIAERKIETAVLYEDDRAIGFRDVNPKAPIHVLVIPKEHIESLSTCQESHKELLGHLMLVAKKLAESENLTKNGYRIVLNTGTYGGQTVQHYHLHLLGGRSFGWPPG